MGDVWNEKAGFMILCSRKQEAHKNMVVVGEVDERISATTEHNFNKIVLLCI